ncbi:hypothetical protein ES288_A12G117600v1 [Gossypium darwinii]|uniref:Glutathione transferase n=1 Tax=Gossypium darwinii TaxID=34276 RepID=A0A5D2E9E2_GOSDA|nr:hypothetical protein ES288_A12G117600v1 [Gossypium darwinii]
MAAIIGESPKLALYSYWQSSWISYEYKAVNLSKGEQFTPEFEKLNPLHFVPVLDDGDVVVSDSYAILLYLEEKYPQIALLPDPQLKALNLQVASIVTSSIQPLHMLSNLKYLVQKVGPQESLLFAQTMWKKVSMVTLEKLLKDINGKYASGDEVYMADVFMAPQIAVAMQRFKIDMSKYPRLCRIFESLKALPEFLDASPERQPDAVH